MPNGSMAPTPSQRLRQLLVHLASGVAVHVLFLGDHRKRPLGSPRRLEERGEVAAVPHPGHLQFHGPDPPRVPGALPLAVALSHALGRARGTAPPRRALLPPLPPSP